MSPPPLRVDMNASRRPSGENNGRRSVASCETSKRASPPVDGTDQISPPETNAISEPSGDTPGSDSTNIGVVLWVQTRAIDRKVKKRPMARTLEQGTVRKRTPEGNDHRGHNFEFP